MDTARREDCGTVQTDRQIVGQKRMSRQIEILCPDVEPISHVSNVLKDALTRTGRWYLRGDLQPIAVDVKTM